MVTKNTFFIERRSARLASGTGGLVRDSIPPGLANQVASLVDGVSRSSGSAFEQLFRETWMTLRNDPRALRPDPLQVLTSGQLTDYQLDRLQELLVTAPDVAAFLEVVELLVKVAKRMNWEVAYLLLKDGSEEAFVSTRFGYRFSGDDIVEAGTDVENEAVDETRERLLSDPRFADAEAKFVSALQKATSNRDTDYPEAVHASVSALEEVARELLHDENITLEPALEKLRQQHNLDPNVTDMLKKLYHARGNLGGAAHGAGSASASLAKYFIHTSAAGMLYLIGECTASDQS